MRWIVDVGLRDESRSAIGYAGSLARAAAARGEGRVQPVHVLGQDHLRHALRMHHLDEVVDETRAAAHRLLGDARDGDVFGDLEIVQAVYEEDGLAATREAHEADAVIVAREDHRLLRLGRVARRMLRDPPCPVVVVPPELRDGTELDGPIVALTDLAEHSVAAYQFAARLARDADRDLVALHVVRGDATGDERRVISWASACGLPADRYVVAQGDVVAQARALAEPERALSIVTGIRPRTGLDRMFGPSTARRLAARAAVPVTVVPSGAARREAAAASPRVGVPQHA